MVAVIAHPDDEIFVSGTLCLLAEKGFKITLVCITDGENGSHELLREVGSSLPLGVIRRREVELSSWALGVRAIVFLRLADVTSEDWDKATNWDRPGLVESLTAIFRQAEPALILTHGPLGGYGHPAHRAVHQCVMDAAASGFRGSIYSFCGNVPTAFFSWHFDQPSNVRIDARGFFRQRAAALSYHQTQIDYFLQPRFPKTIRKWLSAAVGYLLGATEFGRKRIPIGTRDRFFARFPTEGLVLHQAAADGRSFFQENFKNDLRVEIGR